MKKIVIIGANDFQNQLILKAKEMGFETHVFAWKDGSVGERTADYFYPISIKETEQIVEKCREICPDAVASIASDLANITVSKVASALGLPCNSQECIRISTNKYAMREAFTKARIATPRFYRVDRMEAYLYGLKLPVVVKRGKIVEQDILQKIPLQPQRKGLVQLLLGAPDRIIRAPEHVSGVVLPEDGVQGGLVRDIAEG